MEVYRDEQNLFQSGERKSHWRGYEMEVYRGTKSVSTWREEISLVRNSYEMEV
jgi:hypothetical protein